MLPCFVGGQNTAGNMQFCVSRGRRTYAHLLYYYQLHIRLTEHISATEYIFNFCIFGQQQFRAGRFSNALPNAKLWTLPASLKDDTTKMNDRNKHKVTGQMNHQTADPKANASVFLFFSTAHFLKTILASRTNGTFGFARHTSRPFAKPKEPFFANARTGNRTDK